MNGVLVPCVIPVAAADALAWAKGQLHDKDLILHSPLVPEAVFVVAMQGRVDYRQMIERVRYWRLQGAICLICRTAHPRMEHHITAAGGLMGFCDGPGGLDAACRFFLPPAAFDAWLAKWARLESRFAAVSAGAGNGDFSKTEILEKCAPPGGDAPLSP